MSSVPVVSLAVFDIIFLQHLYATNWKSELQMSDACSMTQEFDRQSNNARDVDLLNHL